jgi:hypothetical protein
MNIKKIINQIEEINDYNELKVIKAAVETRINLFYSYSDEQNPKETFGIGDKVTWYSEKLHRQIVGTVVKTYATAVLVSEREANACHLISTSLCKLCKRLQQQEKACRLTKTDITKETS